MTGSTLSCGCLLKDMLREKRTKNLVGQKFGKLTVICRTTDVTIRGRNMVQWKCICECNPSVPIIVLAASLNSGQKNSCGCILRTQGGMSNDPRYKSEYKSWEGMHKRCNAGPETEYYKYYVALGVGVCERWSSFPMFHEDMGPKPSPDHTLDRWPDPYGNYEPGNCRWATSAEQAFNFRDPYRNCLIELTKWAVSLSIDEVLRSVALQSAIAHLQDCGISI